MRVVLWVIGPLLAGVTACKQQQKTVNPHYHQQTLVHQMCSDLKGIYSHVDERVIALADEEGDGLDLFAGISTIYFEGCQDSTATALLSPLDGNQRSDWLTTENDNLKNIIESMCLGIEGVLESTPHVTVTVEYVRISYQTLKGLHDTYCAE